MNTAHSGNKHLPQREKYLILTGCLFPFPIRNSLLSLFYMQCQTGFGGYPAFPNRHVKPISTRGGNVCAGIKTIGNYASKISLHTGSTETHLFASFQRNYLPLTGNSGKLIVRKSPYHCIKARMEHYPARSLPKLQ